MPPSPMPIFEALTAYQRTAAVKAAIELDLFSAVGAGARTAQAIAERVQASARGVRALADYLVSLGLVTGQEGSYALSEDAQAFLDRRSPAYMGSAIGFINSEHLMRPFTMTADAVRKGGTAFDAHGTTAPDHPCWVEFARAMAPMARLTAEMIADLLAKEGDLPPRVLDVAAGHGMYGIALARRSAEVRVTALDWAGVLAVARENAAQAGVKDRYAAVAGSAFDQDLGGPYDLVLLTNFLHHFDEPACVGLLKRVRAALAPGGRVVVLEFVPDDGRTTPPEAARFGLVMVVTTPAGNAYTFREYAAMLGKAGFGAVEHRRLEPTPQSAILARA